MSFLSWQLGVVGVLSKMANNSAAAEMLTTKD